MIITVTLFSVILILFVVNTISDHVFNWGIRTADNEESGASLFVLICLYIIKTIILISILKYYLS